MSEGDGKPTKNMGPHGLGDPNDKTLRKLEKDVLIEQMMRDIARTEKCAEFTEALEKCGRDNGWKGVFTCRKENEKMKECMAHWYHNEDFRKEVTEMYLQQRTDYRKTGLSKKMRKELESLGYEINIKS
ncbi:hypothetical protein M8J76_015032 [Diaphorina citri]|nr:hypothetical protein M8J75_010426 [Diaphorina citri]KAI5750358.1 hypothetical protein M8J76_015032 [Diaphorina citri]